MTSSISPATRPKAEDDLVLRRQALMALLAEATKDEIIQIVTELGADALTAEAVDLRRPESGLVMLRGRAGGDGRAFNLGEATVTRAAIRLPDGRTGFAYQLGRDSEKARFSAILDALCQGDEHAAVERAAAPVRQRIAAEAAAKARRVAATKVDFFTMVRGED